MAMCPNFEKIQKYTEARLNGIMTTDEAIAAMQKLLSPETFIPEEELMNHTGETALEIKLTNDLGRVESKLDALVHYLTTPAPSGDASN